MSRLPVLDDPGSWSFSSAGGRFEASSPSRAGSDAASTRDALSIGDESLTGVAVGRSKHDVFISYAWNPALETSDGRTIYFGQRKAHSLAKALREAGYTVWLDVEHMAVEASRDTTEAMCLAISRARAVVMCISREYAESDNCKAEVMFARQAKKALFFVKCVISELVVPVTALAQ